LQTQKEADGSLQHTVDCEVRVPYADTDQMGMVYYANYLVYFERGRTEWLRHHGLTYKNLESREIYFPVVECYCKYQSPARYDDVITVRTWLPELGLASIEFSYEIRCGERVIATGTTKHPLVNRSFKPVRIPAELRRMLEEKHA
jgi:acyl-CoA thioester hydrolase